MNRCNANDKGKGKKDRQKSDSHLSALTARRDISERDTLAQAKLSSGIWAARLF